VVVDARAPERYRGDVEPIDPVAGRIPGAVNWPFVQAADVPGEIREADEIVVYCGSGITACVDLLALAEAGRPDAKLYPGSWSEWCHRGLPVERG
jgi:thiosulfate/3-mercaptopyruvate sulfurtransferase